MHVLFESQRFLVTQGGYGPPVITFQSLRPDQGIETYRDNPWGSGFFDATGFCWINIQPEVNDWYQSLEIHEIAQIVKLKLGEEKPILYGSSMGGYAAYRFSGLFNAKGWIAVVPQHAPFSDVVEETRWPQYRNLIQMNEWSVGDLPPVEGIGLVFVDPELDLDLQHATAIKNDTDALIKSFPGAGHELLATLHSRGTLKDQILESINHIQRETHFNNRSTTQSVPAKPKKNLLGFLRKKPKATPQSDIVSVTDAEILEKLPLGLSGVSCRNSAQIKLSQANPFNNDMPVFDVTVSKDSQIFFHSTEAAQSGGLWSVLLLIASVRRHGEIRCKLSAHGISQNYPEQVVETTSISPSPKFCKLDRRFEIRHKQLNLVIDSRNETENFLLSFPEISSNT